MKRIIIIGNSCSLLEQKNGDIIDGYDYIVRMGGTPRIKGYEKHVGTKTNMYCMKWFKYFNVEVGINDTNFGQMREKLEIEYDDVLCLLQDPDNFYEVAIPFQRYEKNSLNRSFYYQIGDRYLHDSAILNFNLQQKQWYFFNSIDMQQLVCYLQGYDSNIRYNNGIEPTAGLCVIWFFMQNFSNCEITVTGFDGFKTGHYWKPAISTFFQSHNGLSEWMFIKKLIKRGDIRLL